MQKEAKVAATVRDSLPCTVQTFSPWTISGSQALRLNSFEAPMRVLKVRVYV